MTAEKPLPTVPVLAVTTSTQALSTLGAFALAAAAPRVAADLGVSAALIGYQVAVVYLGAALLALVAGGPRAALRRCSHEPAGARAGGRGLRALGGGATAAGRAGAFIMGLGYGATNPAASQLLSRVPSRRMNLMFSLKQTGVPIGGVLSGVIVPPLTVAVGWQAALATCAVMIALLGAAIGLVRRDWDTSRSAGAPVLGSAAQSLSVVWRQPILRWLAIASFLYSGVQLSLTGFLLTYLVSDVALGLVVAGTVLSITHASGAVGRIVWGMLADRLRSGGVVLMANGAASIAARS
jgi:dipeptide/tripeptide permease